jgi:hypothetical protein
MATLRGEPSSEASGWYSDTRHTAGAEVGVHALELAAEKLMEISQSEAPSEEQLRNALSGYVELVESAKGVEDSVKRVNIMLRVTGQNLMEKV